MTNPAANLYEDIAQIDSALEPFTGPQVEERPGLRWMRRTLVERREHIEGKIAEAERSTLQLQVRTASGSGAVPVRIAATLLDAVQRAIDAAAREVDRTDGLPAARAGDALRFEVGAAEASAAQWQITLRRPAGPLSAQPMLGDGTTLLVDAVLEALLRRCAEGDAGDLGQLVTTEGLSLDLTTTSATGDGGTVSLDRHTLTTTD